MAQTNQSKEPTHKDVITNNHRSKEELAVSDNDTDMKTVHLSTDSMPPNYQMMLPFQVNEFGDGTVTLNDNKILQ